MKLKIGRVSATESNPSSCDSFVFWLDDNVRLSPFDIVKVENKIGSFSSLTYAVVQDILHITDSPGHMSNYISSDFGDLEAQPLTQKLGLSYALASVVHNDKENYMPVREGSDVMTADAEDIKKALGLDNIPSDKCIPAGIMKTSTGVSVPVNFNSDFLVGPEGAHLNISGISGLATKTSYAMFLLQAIQHYQNDVAIIVLNVKGDDLLRLDENNDKITQKQRDEWSLSGLQCAPFANVSYFYPYTKQEPHSLTVLNNATIERQKRDRILFNYIYTFQNDKEKLDLLFTNVDDPNDTIESIINFIMESDEFSEGHWEDFKKRLREYTNRETKQKKTNQDITIQSWRRFSRLINNSINNDIFQKSESGDPGLRHVSLSEKIKEIKSGHTFVVDIAKLDEQLQCLVFGDVIKAVYELKHGGTDREDIPRRIVIFVDELNKYAPSTAVRNSAILNYLKEISERGRSEGVILVSAEQFKSAVNDKIKGNCSSHVYGRTNAIEISKPDYRYIPKVYANMMTRLGKGDLIIEHPIFKTLLKISFPFPSYKQGAE